VVFLANILFPLKTKKKKKKKKKEKEKRGIVREGLLPTRKPQPDKGKSRIFLAGRHPWVAVGAVMGCDKSRTKPGLWGRVFCGFQPHHPQLPLLNLGSPCKVG
jgi:hypothetical protein